eukprot:168334-Karenia_brevis.AAC.1
MDLEELVPVLTGKTGREDDDSVGGLMRFLIAHWSPVVNRLLPEGSPEEVQQLIETDEYFNTLSFDEVARAMVNILLLLVRLFPQHQRRADE